ncbi:MAG: alpha/beta-type small acid-soluble spore protein [Clostridia bacterium]|nr:alpha/beta-type small acid-soluble spore protein [Clostridia bacterium]MDD4048093.1 alpha/beta-type small acid-soluble spore protein [Clostridia bacterium]
MSSNTNKPAVQGVAQALDQMKYEVAGELGINNYAQVDKGQLTSRQNGYVGGYMTKKLVQYAEEAMAKGQLV